MTASPIYSGTVTALRQRSPSPIYSGEVNAIRGRLVSPIYSGAVKKLRTRSPSPIYSGLVSAVRGQAPSSVIDTTADNPLLQSASGVSDTVASFTRASAAAAVVDIAALLFRGSAPSTVSDDNPAIIRGAAASDVSDTEALRVVTATNTALSQAVSFFNKIVRQTSLTQPAVSDIPGNTLDKVATLPSEFVLRRGYEGPQIIIEWNAPATPSLVVTLHLVRRRFGFPQNIADGDTIWAGPPSAQILSDRDVVDCVCYFYTLFARLDDGTSVSLPSTAGQIIALQTGFHGPKSYDLFSAAMKLQDKGQSEPAEIRKSLVEGTLPLHPEVFNIGQDPHFLRGPLQRLFYLMGPMLDEAKGLIDCFRNQLDVDDACLPALGGIAALFGLALNKELPPEKMRNEVRQTIPFLQQKGTKPAIISRFQAVSGVTPTVIEQHNRLLYSNDVNRTSPAFVLTELANIGGPNDELFYSPGYAFNVPNFWLWFSVFVPLPAGAGLTEATLTKWCKSVSDGTPVCHKGFLIIDQALSLEEMPVTFSETTTDELEASDTDTITVSFSETPTDEIVPDATKFLITNDVTHATNADNWTSVTAIPGP